ncbi:MAG: hypothetical protein HY888_08140 [Deltaproteobacteria bacterium]|nr:hypothetical protein [Deltaproteobacteria bacterium]
MPDNLSRKIILIGSGALARDLVGICGRDFFVGTFIDPGFPETPVEGLPVFTNWNEARRVASHYALGVLDSSHRQKARQDALKAGLLPMDPFIHHTAQVAAGTKVAPGCLVGCFSVIGPAAELLEDVLVMHSVVVAHDTIIGDGSVLLPGAWIGGYTRVGSGCLIGANSSLVPRITIGSNSFVAAGAACFKDAPPDSVLIGNPARRSEMARKSISSDKKGIPA